jgi:hypothetical protein
MFAVEESGQPYEIEFTGERLSGVTEPLGNCLSQPAESIPEIPPGYAE